MQATKHLYHALYPFLCEYNVRHDQGSALLWAAREGDSRLVTELLAVGANIAAHVPPPRRLQAKPGMEIGGIDPLVDRNPLLNAAEGRHIETLKILLEETRSGQGALRAQLRPVLHWALRRHDAQLVELMLAHQAPLNPATKARASPSALGAAVVSGYKAILPRLVAAGARPGPNEWPCPIEQAIRTGQPSIVRLLLEQGVSLRADTAVSHIAHKDDRVMLRLLLEYGIDLNLYGCAALFTVVRDGHYEMVQLLLDHGAPTDLHCDLFPPSGIPVGSYYSLIGFAIIYARLDILRLLLDRGTLPQPGDLALATRRNLSEAVALLAPFAEQELHWKSHIELHVNILQMNKKRQDPKLEGIKYTTGIVDTSGTIEPDPPGLETESMEEDSDDEW
ncbi:ankyrin [Aspergillus sclerotiicarbonarius CBS 121057]|uniref:Ankyrin n=1 Tax=Aspergillus sclerotiicarbonarius (strain CBS 121057 / IBT 28362) TaxID=1448318 RepID=A0A319EIS6_ASPSB|nr:ankyrin [Aspergillus sclerotiicarbonarius CBS 121057]